MRAYLKPVLGLILTCIYLPHARAQDHSADDAPVTREEFNRLLDEFRQFREDYGRLKKENEELKSELDAVRARISEPPEGNWRAELESLSIHQRETIMEDVRQEIRDVTEPIWPGTTKLAFSGGAVATYQDRENVDSTFGFGIAPIVLWKPSERLLFEGEFGFILAEDDTEVELGLAQINYLLNDYFTLGAGLFRNPFLTFWERWHPSWINKAANFPLIYERGLVGPSALGVQLRGGTDIGPTKVNYTAYYVNGPDFRTSQAAAGRLGFNNFRDNNNNKGFGLRLGFLPIPELEVGYSFFTGRVGDSGSDFSRVDASMHGVDLAYAREFEPIKGRLDLRAEAVWIDADNVIFTGPFDPFTFDNKRNGWFVQAAYRPTLVDLKLGSGVEMKNFEFVARYDQLREPGPGRLGADRERLTLGVDYWISPSIVVKTAYSHDNVRGGKDEDAVFAQFAVGF